MPYTADVWKRGWLVQEGLWELRRYDPAARYWDKKNGRPIGSIGRSVWDGRIYAAIDARFADDMNYDCLFLG